MGILELILLLLVLSWAGGLIFNIGGGLIHLLLVAAVVIFIARLLNRNTAL